MGRVDIASVGASYRSEADRAFSRALAFAVILLMAHFLEIRPSEIDAFGLKVSNMDPVLLYGAISMVFWYYASRAAHNSEHGVSLLPLNVEPHRIRANLRASRKLWKSEKKNKNKSMDHVAIKKTARGMMKFGDILVIPYFIAAAMFIMAAIPMAIIDLYKLGELVVERQFLK